ncbi:MAG: hypothetical protein HFK07_01085 [Clostridia bacterium]|jgi:hypothetical protein|nr:hypothetical protein [Clostridia bacterium]
MKRINIGITHGSREALYDTSVSDMYLGRQWENYATKLVFERPRGEEGSAMFLTFDTPYGERIGSVSLGTNNVYLIPSVVMERSEVVLGVTFVRGSSIMNARPIRFSIDEAPKPVEYERQGFTGDVLDAVLDIIAHAMYAVETTRDARGKRTLVYRNRHGAVVAEEPLEDTGIVDVNINSAGHLMISFMSGDIVDIGKVKASDITDAKVNSVGDLVITKDDGTVINAGRARGNDGLPGRDGKDGNAAVAPNLNWRGEFNVRSTSYSTGDIVRYKDNLWVAKKDITPSTGGLIINSEIPPETSGGYSSAWLLFLEGARMIKDETAAINEYLSWTTNQEIPHSISGATFLYKGAMYKKNNKVYMCNNTYVEGFYEDRGGEGGITYFFLLPEETCELAYPGTDITISYSWNQFWLELFNVNDLKGIQGERGVGVDIKNPKIYATAEAMRADTAVGEGTYALIPSEKTVYVKTSSGEWKEFGYTNDMPVIGLSSGGGGGSNLIFFESEEGEDISTFEKKGSSAVDNMRVWTFDLPEGYSPQSGDTIHMAFKAVYEEDGMQSAEYFTVSVAMSVVDIVTSSGKGVFAEAASTVGRLSGIVGCNIKGYDTKSLQISFTPTAIFGEHCYITINPNILIDVAGDDFIYGGDSNAHSSINKTEYNSLVTNSGKGGIVFTKISRYSGDYDLDNNEYPFFKMRTEYNSGNVTVKTDGDFDMMYEQTSQSSLPKNIKLMRGEIIR